MKSNFLKWMCVSVVTLSLALGGTAAYAKEKGEEPSGWSKGQKKGWQGGEVPPGLADKEKKVKEEAGKAEKDLEKEQKKAAKEAKRQQKKAEKEARKAKRQAEKEARKAEREAEKAKRQVEREAEEAKKEVEEKK